MLKPLYVNSIFFPDFISVGRIGGNPKKFRVPKEVNVLFHYPSIACNYARKFNIAGSYKSSLFISRTLSHA